MPATIVVMMHSPSKSKCSQPISEILLSPLARAAASRPGARFLEALPVLSQPCRVRKYAAVYQVRACMAGVYLLNPHAQLLRQQSFINSRRCFKLLRLLFNRSPSKPLVRCQARSRSSGSRQTAPIAISAARPVKIINHSCLSRVRCAAGRVARHCRGRDFESGCDLPFSIPTLHTNHLCVHHRCMLPERPHTGPHTGVTLPCLRCTCCCGRTVLLWSPAAQCASLG